MGQEEGDGALQALRFHAVRFDGLANCMDGEIISSNNAKRVKTLGFGSRGGVRLACVPPTGGEEGSLSSISS